MPTKKSSTMHQARTQATREKLLAAAETAFVRDGFEGAQLGEIALEAGRTKGSVYANFKSKEDLFLALFEERARRIRERLFTVLGECKNRMERLEAFKKFYIDLIRDKAWPLLTLEFMFYSIRHPESNDRLQKAYESMQRDQNDPVYQQVFGVLTPKRLHSVQVSVMALSPILAALLLESECAPSRFSDKDVTDLLTQIFDSFFPPF